MKFTLHHGMKELEALGADWNALLQDSSTNVPFLRHEYLSAWWDTRGGGEWPPSHLAVVTACNESRLAGIAPMFITNGQDGQAALLLLGSIEVSDYLDVIAHPADLPDFLSGLLEFLSSPDMPAWQLLDWHNLPEGSPTLPALEAEAGKRGWSFTREQTYHVPAIPLGRDFETYLAGIDKKQRHEIRRKMRRVEESGRAVRWYMVQNGDSLEAEVEAFMGMMAQDPNKEAFLTPLMRTQMQRTCQAAFLGGWLQLAFLEVEGEKAAGYLNFDYLNRIWVYNSGFDRRFMDLSAGWVLLGYLLKWACENGRSEFDFMRGREDYKYRFGGVDRFVVRATVRR